MTKGEFQSKWLRGSMTPEMRDERLRDLTSLLEDEQKAAKLDAFTIALRLHEKNPEAFREIMKSLIEAKPPKSEMI